MAKTSNTQNRAPRMGEVYALSLSEVKVATLENGKKMNQRIDFGDIEEFAEEIYSHGKIENALHGYRKDGIYWITDGERRMLCVAYINKKYNTDFVIPFKCESKETTAIDRLYKQRIMNNGVKPFTPVEDACLVNELLSQGETEKQICAKLKFSGVHVSNLKLLYNAPEEIKTFIREGVLSPTEASRILRKEKDFDLAIATIRRTLAFVKEEKGELKTNITTKDVIKAEGKVNSFSALKKAFKLAPKRVIKEENKELFEQLKKFVDGEITFEWLVEQLYEPEGEKELDLHPAQLGA